MEKWKSGNPHFMDWCVIVEFDQKTKEIIGFLLFFVSLDFEIKPSLGRFKIKNWQQKLPKITPSTKQTWLSYLYFCILQRINDTPAKQKQRRRKKYFRSRGVVPLNPMAVLNLKTKKLLSVQCLARKKYTLPTPGWKRGRDGQRGCDSFNFPLLSLTRTGGSTTPKEAPEQSQDIQAPHVQCGLINRSKKNLLVFVSFWCILYDLFLYVSFSLQSYIPLCTRGLKNTLLPIVFKGSLVKTIRYRANMKCRTTGGFTQMDGNDTCELPDLYSFGQTWGAQGSTCKSWQWKKKNATRESIFCKASRRSFAAFCSGTTWSKYFARMPSFDGPCFLAPMVILVWALPVPARLKVLFQTSSDFLCCWKTAQGCVQQIQMEC